MSRNVSTSNHCEVVSLAVYLKVGEFDDTLEWPVNVAVTIQLVSQECDNCHTKVIRFISESKKMTKKGVLEASFIKCVPLPSVQPYG